jgi:hypothetical protein
MHKKIFYKSHEQAICKSFEKSNFKKDILNQIISNNGKYGEQTTVNRIQR